MDADSCSMTPPLSPGTRYTRDEDLQQLLVGEQQQDPDPVCWSGVIFLCKGEGGITSPETFHPAGPLKSGSLNSHLKGGESGLQQALQFSANNSILFGYNFTSYHIAAEQLTRLFQFSKQWITKVEMFPATSLTQEQNDQLLGIRRHIKGFLEYLTVLVTKNIDRPDGEDLCDQITDGLRGLLLYLGDLSEKMSFVTAGKSRQMTTKCSHNFHMHLDVYWGVLQVLTKMGELKADKYPDAGFELSLTKEVVNRLLWQLVAASSTGYPKQTAFPCCCVKEIYVILIHLLSRRHTAGLTNREGFWSVFNDLIERLQKPDVVPDEDTAMEVDSTDLSSPPPLTSDNPAGLGVWLIVNLAPLFAYSSKGDHDQQSAPCSNYPIVQKLIKACVTSAGRGECELQVYLQWCVRLTHLWEPSVTLTMTLWDYFSGQLNQNFKVASSGIEGLASMRKTPASLLAECKRLTDREGLFSKGGETSFSLFLHVLADTLKQFISQGSAREWRQLKGRIFSKFHQRRMLELRETGLYNLTRLFVTLNLVVLTDIHTVAGKLCDLYDLLDTGGVDTRTWSTVSQGRFCLCAIFLQKQLDIAFMADKMSKSFNVLCSEYCQQHMDSMTKQKLWGMVMSYMENVAELLDGSPHLHLGQHKLIGEALCETLSHLSPNELHRLLVCAINILNNVRSVHTSGEGKDQSIGLREILAKMWKIFHVFLTTFSTTDTPPPEVADLAACLSINTVELAEDNTSACASFQYFALKEDVNIRITLRYLDHVLESPSMITALSQCLTNCSNILVKVWLRASLLCPQSQSNLLSNINRVMLKQREVMDVVSAAGMGGNPVSENGIVMFFKALGLCYLKAKGLKDKIDVRNKSIGYCEDTARFVTPILRQYAPLDILTSVYRVCGQMIRYCGPMLYIKSQPDCPLPTLIDRLVLPHSLLDSKKAPNPNLLTVLRETGHWFLLGLSLLDYQRDPYVKRRVRDIILQFLHRFPLVDKVSPGVNLGMAQSLHPAVSCLGKSLTKSPTEESSKFRQFVMTLVVENFLKVTSMTLPQNAVMGLSFVTEVFRRTADAGEITRDAVNVLEVLLECSLLADHSAVRQHINHLLQVTLEACAKHSSPQLIESLVPPVQRFVEKYVKLQPSKVLGVSLEKVAVFHPAILVNMLPSLTEALLNLERKRGVGADRQLRDVYYKLLEQLGQAGTEEKLRLQTSG